VTPFRFAIKNVDEHFHLPLKFTRCAVGCSAARDGSPA
jgi:5-hydroxyisourate hydrolase-like protein (transthyretin family)